ncbi:hypothetical protein C1645_546823 [Glomus cerebriforme]|uniref:Cryptic loci regulator 2 N-terminal domain-containing protein n=1 Tax=Glomus cerebriforme TaxID=658196 RepID=A0A397TBF9_9GLOM|nr:hypothetical protein C1645_546823 [Glomus cerebriforme]
MIDIYNCHMIPDLIVYIKPKIHTGAIIFFFFEPKKKNKDKRQKIYIFLLKVVRIIIMTYQILEDGITINVSDEIFVFPDKKTPTPDDDGVISYYELLNSKDSKNIFWREKLGEGMKTSFKDATFPKAILTDFPKGYKLYAHRKKHPKKGERTDYYLFGIIIFNLYAHNLFYFL